MRDIRFLISLLLIGKCITEGAPGTPLPFLQGGPKCVADSAPRIPVPFLRGGSTAAARTRKIQQQRRPRKGGVKPIGIVVNKVKQGIGKLGGKIRHDTVHIGKNIGREWGKLTTSARRLVVNIPKILPRRKSLKSCKKLDEACHTFASVLRGDEIDTSQLLKACHAHLALMKSGGSALRLVAKDLESNVHKAEKVFKKISQGWKVPLLPFGMRKESRHTQRKSTTRKIGGHGTPVDTTFPRLSTGPVRLSHSRTGASA